ncbi:MAG: lipid-A-disaccharide synthase [Candidatus Solibacter usitatus]|nr:lipid-A-disaccharide synthase [Candidatus Solibacter usitatus]
MIPKKVFVSAGESSGDMYAAQLVKALNSHWRGTEYFGCCGPQMAQAGVRTVIDSSVLSVVGLVEVLTHLPGIYRQYRKLVRAVASERPEMAILTDSPDFHLRVAKRMEALGIPVIYLVAPQAWAWRQGRVKQMRRTIRRLLCLFPFEESFFRERGVNAHYIGHPLARTIRPSLSKHEFFQKHAIPTDKPLIVLCPGSRRGEIARHMPYLMDAASRIQRSRGAHLVLASPLGFAARAGGSFFRERISGASIQVIEGETWDALAHADLALTASGTVTMEAALLGTPLITYYRVTALSWMLGRWLVRVPFFSMVNLIAGKRVAPELMQNEMTGERLAQEALFLLENEEARRAMRHGMEEVKQKLVSEQDPMEQAARIVKEFFDEHERQH